MATNTHITTRRALLGAAAATPILLIGTPAISHSGDASILAAWAVGKKALEGILERGEYRDCETHSPDLAQVYDDAKQRIVETEATTPKGALIQAWVAWSFIGTEFHPEARRIGDLIRRADFARLEAEQSSLDWDHVCMLQVVRTLRTLVGEVA